jgi:hypothetical protein
MSRGPWRGLLVAVISVSLITPVATTLSSHAATGLGIARGFRGVEVSLDGGKGWLPIGQRAFPLLDGAQLRTTSGAAVLALNDGSRVNLLPASSTELRRVGNTTEVVLRSGRLTFTLPRDTRTEIRTVTARLEPVRTSAMAGEVFVGAANVVGLRMSQGSMQVRELAGERRTMLASLEPVFVPKRPPVSGSMFSASVPGSPPAGARGVYTPRGESLGYLAADSRLVVHPGFTRDLTQPYPQRLVQVAMAKIPEGERKDSTPLFDVNGGYVGYLSNSGFYPVTVVGQAGQTQVAQAVGAQGGQLQVAQAVAGEAASEDTNWTPWIVGGSIVAVTGGVVGGLAASGQFSGNGTATAEGTASTAIQPQ